MKTIVFLLITFLVAGCAGSGNPYVDSSDRMYRASEMNTTIVNNSLATLQCPPGYKVSKEDVRVEKRVSSEYSEKIGGRRSNTYFPRAEHSASDISRGDGRLKCERIK
ncbi:hypothetical protein GW937_00470 [Candidatus Kaiserbacteria bacterium]|nr:hypothetical protein [Candidatus Kaiserbacteria bacterium]